MVMRQAIRTCVRCGQVKIAVIQGIRGAIFPRSPAPQERATRRFADRFPPGLNGTVGARNPA